MAILLGRSASAPPLGGNIISATYTSECDTIDISDRVNVGSSGYKATATGFVTNTWEIECHDPNGLIEGLEEVKTTGWQVMSVTEDIKLDNALVYKVTLKQVG